MSIDSELWTGVRPPKFCQECGQQVNEVNETKFVCPSGHKSYLNPVPVGVGIIPAEGGGFILVRRNINPVKGLLAFPGGNAGTTRSIQEEISREILEEIGLPTNPNLFVPLDFRSATDNGKILLFATYTQPVSPSFDWRFDDNEVSEVVIATSVPDDMAFPLHAEVLQQLLDL